MSLFPDRTDIQEISGVIRVYNAREPGSSIRYGSTLRHHELIYKWSGDSVSTLNGREYALSRGSVLYLPKGPCGGYSVKTLRRGEAIDILFETDTPLADGPLLLPGPHKSSLTQLFEQCHERWITSSPGRLSACMAAAYGILSVLQDETQEAVTSSAGLGHLRAAAEYLESRLFDETLRVEDAARQAGISYSYLKRLFMHRYGVSPTQYITERRMENARSWLVTTDLSITELSARLGYSSVFYFSRVFRRINGISPSEYRRRMI